jgi:ketosteroid isomerase-like protein
MSNTIEQFYEAFHHLDAEKMVNLYHPDIEFEDPAFGKLKGERAKNMWRMLCRSQKGKDFRISYTISHFEYEKAHANWEAFYTFSQTGRKVHNRISASFILKDGLIIKHVDDFNLYAWSKQAMGLKGFLLGNTSFFKKKLHQQTNKLLDDFERKYASQEKIGH